MPTFRLNLRSADQRETLIFNAADAEEAGARMHAIAVSRAMQTGRAWFGDLEEHRVAVAVPSPMARLKAFVEAGALAVAGLALALLWWVLTAAGLSTGEAARDALICFGVVFVGAPIWWAWRGRK